MLREVQTPAQNPGEAPRRVFRGSQLELIAWQDPVGEIVQFQLAYDIPNSPKVLEYKGGSIYHYLVDRGPERYTQIDRAGILTPLPARDRNLLSAMFSEASEELPAVIRAAVELAINRLPAN
jgi:hypothetical protein